jgi:flagellar basal body rod protein FlgF
MPRHRISEIRIKSGILEQGFSAMDFLLSMVFSQRVFSLSRKMVNIGILC